MVGCFNFKKNIKSINTLQKKYNIIPGLSDHTIGFIASVSAVARGAKLIEKHFNIKRDGA